MKMFEKLRTRRHKSCDAERPAPTSPGRRRRNHGFTLVEVVVAAGLLLFATSGIVPFFLTGLNQASSVRYKSVATNVARERMEEIRKLDYRDIESASQLEGLFGTTLSQRGITFNINYAVETSEYEDGSLKEVTVTVGWTAPPEVSSASITTMIHQQYLGPRGSKLEVISTATDPLGTPFGLMDSTDVIRYHIATSDWGLLFTDFENPSTSKTDAYCRLAFVDDNGQSIQIGSEANDYKLDNTYLYTATDGDGNLTDVYYQAAVTGLPFWYDADGAVDAFGNYDGFYDGYWELRACAYNFYDQPGNVWRLRVRVENGRPDAVDDLTPAQIDDETVELFWLTGSARDRDHYVVQRRVRSRGGDGATGWGPFSLWSAWVTLDGDLDPGTTYYKDDGDVASQQHPWGSLANWVWNQYEYRVYAVDICDPGKIGKYTVVTVDVPPSEFTTVYTLDITSSPEAGGTVTRDPSQFNYLSGTVVTLTATPAEGYSFTEWSGDASGTDASVTITMDSSKSVTATFADVSATPTYYSVTITNDTTQAYTITIYDEGNNTVHTSSLAKNTTVTVANLLAGDYLIRASRPSNVKIGSFTLPDQTDAIVLSLLD